jgi:hypothetical protein
MPRLLLGLSTACLVLAATAASAQQVFESVGGRALGMGGAFVAVADDSSAVFWNPAGLASGDPAGVTIGWVKFQSGNRTGSPSAGQAVRHATLYSVGSQPLGLSYGTLQATSLFSGTGGTLTAETLRVSQYGATILQSVAPGVIVGSTLKVLRGFASSAPVTSGTVSEALDAGDALKGDSVTRFDYDIGVMLDADHFRLGLTVKNLREPSFPNLAGTAIVLRQQARVGLAVLPTDGLTLAMDVDLDTVDLRDGLRRMIAFGGEDRVGRRFAFRGGVRWSLEGERRRVASVGASFSVKKGYWLDGHYTQGDLDADRGFGVTLRAGF